MEGKASEMSDKVEIYSSGLCRASVCAPATMAGDDVAKAVNTQMPTGIENRWKISDDPTFKSGQTNPCQCEQDETRKHWLLDC